MPDPITAPPPAPSRSAPSTFSTLADAFIAWFAGFVTQLNAVVIAFNLNATSSTSTTSLTIGTGAQSLTVDINKSYLPGMSVKIAYTTTPSNWMHGDVTSYNVGTGALVVNVTTIYGSGTQTAWTVTFSAPTGLPDATAQNDMLVAAPTTFSWIKKTLVEFRAILGLTMGAGASIDVAAAAAVDINASLTVGNALTTPNITAAGEIIYGSAANVESALASPATATGKVLMCNGVAAPEWNYNIQEITELCSVD